MLGEDGVPWLVRADGGCDSGSRGVCHKCGSARRGYGRGRSRLGPLLGFAPCRATPGSLLGRGREPEADCPLPWGKGVPSPRRPLSSQPRFFLWMLRLHYCMKMPALATVKVSCLHLSEWMSVGFLSGGIWKGYLEIHHSTSLVLHLRRPRP